jgi:subtilisin family serine protease/subtilisin-like proprotein convertase family protein
MNKPYRLPLRQSIRQSRLLIESLERRNMLASVAGTVFYDDDLDGILEAPIENAITAAEAGWTVFADTNNNGTFDGVNNSYNATLVPMSLPDDRVTRFNDLTISGATGNVTGLTMNINITHTYLGDLDVFLISPTGTRIDLFTDVGGGTDGINATLDDTAATLISSASTPSSGQLTGTFRPEASLSALNGQAINGTWRLEITDDAGGDSGSLVSWQLNMRSGEASTTVNSGGSYLLDVGSGSFPIRQLARTGFEQHRTLANVNVATNTTNVTGVNFGIRRPPGAVTGFVFADYSNNGIQDAGEPGLIGRTVFMDYNDSGTREANEPQSTTDNTGRYSFNLARPGTAALRTIVPTGWRQTSPTVGGRPGADLGARPASLGVSRGNSNTRETPQQQTKTPDRVAIPGQVFLSTNLQGGLTSLRRQIGRVPALSNIVDFAQSTLLYESQGQSVSLLSIDAKLDPEQVSRDIAALPGIAWAQPNYQYLGDLRELVPNDPQYGSQWHLPLIGAPQAWDTTTGSGVVIAVLDDGVGTAHPDIAPNLWNNTDEILGNNLDDDGNGFIDDTFGWDFHTNDRDPTATGSPHGSPVSGMAAGRINNNSGGSGIAGTAQIMPLRIGAGSYTSATLNSAFRYAADNGARITNLSYNTDSVVNDAVVNSGLDYAYGRGLLLFNSGGNTGVQNPARLGMTQQVFVAATNSSDVKASFSAWGNGMDISAPGDDVFIASGSSGYSSTGGTSFSSPAAAGAAALIWSANPTWTRDQVVAKLFDGVDSIDAVNSSLATQLGTGRINVNKGVNSAITAPRIRSVTNLPTEGSTVITPPTSLTVRFFNFFEPARVNGTAAFRLTEAGGDNTFGTSDDVSIPLTRQGTRPYQAGTNDVTFTINNGGTLVDGTYRFTIVSGGTTGLVDPFGNALDGNSNSVGGDDFVRNFIVTGRTAAHSLNITSNATVSSAHFGQRDIAAPLSTASAFEFETAQMLRFSFNEAMRASAFTPGRVQVLNLTTNAAIDPSTYTTSFDAATNSLLVNLRAPIDNGNYVATLDRNGALDLFGNPLASNVTSTFFFKNGDFNRDRTTDFADLVILARNFNQSGPAITFGSGDANYDRVVNFADLVILARNFNTSIAQPLLGESNEEGERRATDVLDA